MIPIEMKYTHRLGPSNRRWFTLVLAISLGFALFGVQAQEGIGDSPSTDDVPTKSSEAGQTETEEPEASSETSPPESRNKSGLVIVGKIDGEIGFAQSAFVKRLLQEAETKNAGTVMIELNTFGGRVDAAVAIRDALLDADVHTAVFINRRAISAGALISLACKSVAISSGGTIGAATPIMSAPGQETAQPVEEKYLSYFREEMRSTAETNGRNGDIAEAMVDKDKVVEGISEEGKLLTLNTKTALEYEMVDVEAESVTDALEKLGLSGDIASVESSWSETLVSFLTSQAIASLLFLGMALFAYLEYQTPGFGLFGGLALACFLLFYFGHYMVNLAGWEEMLLLILGVVLLAVEAFALPGFGVAGFLGVASVFASLVLTLMAGDWSDITFSNPFTSEALVRVAVTSLVAIVVLLGMARYMPVVARGPLSHLVLRDRLETSEGYGSHEDVDESLLGLSGPALTALRPSGKARIDGRRLNVETQGDFIDIGEEVRVLRQEPGRIVVEKA